MNKDKPSSAIEKKLIQSRKKPIKIEKTPVQKVNCEH